MTGKPLPLVAIVGSTATGKSAFAAALAQRLDGEVVSVDASAVHRGLDVGTAKPPAELRNRVRHHLVDVVGPAEELGLALWLELAEGAVADIRARGHRVVLAGGTGLYLRALLHGLADSGPADEALRRRLHERERHRRGALHRLLRRLDPASAARTPPGNAVRLVRALEHRLRTGRRLSDDQLHWDRPARHACVKIGLRLDRGTRTARIARRVDEMLAAGLVEEVRGLLEAGVSPTARSLRAIGYPEVIAHLKGRQSLEEARSRIVVATRQYAKRQDTWFRREPEVHWFDAARDPAELPPLVERVMMARGLAANGN